MGYARSGDCLPPAAWAEAGEEAQLTRLRPLCPGHRVPKWPLSVTASQLWDPFHPLGDSRDRNTGFKLTMHLVTTTTAQPKKTKTQTAQNKTEPKTELWGEGCSVGGRRTEMCWKNQLIPKMKLIKKSFEIIRKRKKTRKRKKKQKMKQETNTPTEAGDPPMTSVACREVFFLHSPSMHQAQVTMTTRSAKNLATTLPRDAEATTMQASRVPAALASG